ncbi:MAG: peptidoglycan bridge formation glycyltransferase FemA/FemB family protein [bacterium]|nr:peptidoglycan bridge formation glycyltransferase FemA/FemB family protein [bacterium]
MFEIIETKNSSDYNPLLIDKNAPFTQAWFYGEWQEMMGRKVRRFEIAENSETVGYFQVIKYPLIFSRNILYIPHAPVLRSLGEGGAPPSIFLKTFRDKLLEIAVEENAIFVRFDFNFVDLNKYFRKVPFYAYHSVYFQPKYEWVLDIDKPEGELFNNIPRKSRYDIRYAENKGVVIEIIDNNLNKYFEDFYSLLSETAKRNNFSLHQKIYYQNIFANCERNKNAFLILAEYNNKIFTANLILVFGETAYSVFGGSDDKFKNLRTPRLSHWRGIMEAKNRGYKFYNFGAVSSDEDYKSFEGISKFKKGFGGRMAEYSDSYDLVLKPFWHWLYNFRKRYL